MKSFVSVILLASLLGVCLGQTNPWDPQPRYDQGWLNRHEGFVSNTGNNPGLKLLFFGDSITDGWNGQGPIWNEYYAPYSAANYGIGGDQTQHVVWRILKGEVKGLNPTLSVIKIGTNNLGNPNNDQIVDGIVACVNALRQLLPNSKVLILGVLPRNGLNNWVRIEDINAKVSAIADGIFVHFFNMWGPFTATAPVEGTVDPVLFPDGLHLSTQGYRLWAETMNEILTSLMTK